MSELPERKALKEILLKLKTKTLASEKYYRTSSSDLLKGFEEIENLSKKRLKVEEGDVPEIIEFKLKLKSLMHGIYERVHEAIFLSYSICDDLKLYIDSLEIYSTELDKTLTSILEQARKQAEEQIKQREELMKRKSPESYIK